MAMRRLDLPHGALHDCLQALAPNQTKELQRGAARSLCAALKLTHIVRRHVQAPRHDRLTHARPLAQRLNVLSRQIVNCREAAHVEFAHGLFVNEAKPVHAAHALVHGLRDLAAVLTLARHSTPPSRRTEYRRNGRGGLAAAPTNHTPEGFCRRVAKAAPDGFTLLMAIGSTLIMNQFLCRTLFADLTTTPPPC